MVDVKPINDVVTKWETRSGGATQDYTKGAVAAANKYATEAGAAAPNYQAGVTASFGRNAYQTGVQKAGAAKYSMGVTKKGGARYAGGITAGKESFSQGMTGVLSTLQGVTLPARGPRGSPGNIQRVAAIASALRAAKVGSGGA